VWKVKKVRFREKWKKVNFCETHFFRFFWYPQKSRFLGGTCVVSVVPLKSGFLGVLRAVIEGRIEEKKKVRFPPKLGFGALFRVWGTFRGTLVWRVWRTPPAKKWRDVGFGLPARNLVSCRKPKNALRASFTQFWSSKKKIIHAEKKFYRNIFQKIIFLLRGGSFFHFIIPLLRCKSRSRSRSTEIEKKYN